MSHGGKRDGSGRPPADPDLKKIPVNLKLPAYIVDWLREQDESQAVLIEQALLDTYDIPTPD